MNKKHFLLALIIFVLMAGCFQEKENNETEEINIIDQIKSISMSQKRDSTSNNIDTGIFLKKGDYLYHYEYEDFFNFSREDELKFALNWGNADSEKSFVVYDDDSVVKLSDVRAKSGNFNTAKEGSSLTITSLEFSVVISQNTEVKDGVTYQKKYADGKGPRVTFDAEAGIVEKGTTLRLSSINGNEIRYSIDNSNIDINSLIYTTLSGIDVNENITVKARAYADGWKSGSEYEKKYIINPKITGIETPVNKATDVSKTTNIVIKFDKSIASFGTIAFENPGITFENGINCNMILSQELLENDTLTINPDNNLMEETTYTLVKIKDFIDSTGQEMSESILNSDDYSFTVGDETAPEIIEISPIDDLTRIAISSNIVITLNEALDEETIGIVSFSGRTYTADEISISGNIIMINPTSNFVELSDYSNIQISGFKDTAGNTMVSYDGTNYNFITEDITLPSINSYSPVDETGEIDLDSNIKIVFSETLDVSAIGTISFQTPDITFENSTNCAISFTKTNVKNDTIIINSDENLKSSATYSVITINGFKDLAGNTLNNLEKSDYNFTVIDATKPEVNIITPTTGSSGHSTTGNIEIIFDENLDDSIFGIVTLKSPAISFVKDINCSMSIIGSSIIITPTTGKLIEKTTYTGIRIENFFDLKGNKMDIYNGDTYTLTTGDDIKPSVNALYPLNGDQNIPVNTSFQFIFNSSLDTGIKGSLEFLIQSLIFNMDNSTIRFSKTKLENDTIIIEPNIELSESENFSNIKITGFKDTSGNEMNEYIDNGYEVKVEDITRPILGSVIISSSNANGSYAKIGDTITLSIISSEDISIPVVIIAGKAATESDAGDSDAKTWKATYTMQNEDIEGVIPFIIDFKDTSVNTNAGAQVSGLTAGSGIVFDRTEPIVNAGSDVNWTNEAVNLNSTNSDVGSGISLYSWIKTSGTGEVTFNKEIEDPIFTGAEGIETTYILTLTVTDNAGNSASDAVDIKWDKKVPTVGNSGIITTIDVTRKTLNLNWTTASDTNTSIENLQYKVVRASSSETIDTIAEADANSGITLLQNWTANKTNLDVTGLSVETSYCFNVIIKDEAENKAIYIVKVETTLPAEMVGSGTESSPYMIMSIEDLAVIGKGTIAGDGKNYTMLADYKLGTDLDFTSDSSYQNAEGLDIYDADNDADTTEVLKTAMLESSGLGFYPRGKYETIDGNLTNNCFTGVFDGGNFTISNLYINRIEESQDVGLFGNIMGGEIKNLTLENAKVFGKMRVGAIVGTLSNKGSNLHVTNVNVSGTEDYIGGVAGIVSGNIENCTSDGIVNGRSQVGGIIGNFSGFSSTVTKCYSLANVNASIYAGGIIGLTYKSGKISECYSAGDVTASSYGGGLVGQAQVTEIENCYSIGTVETASTSTSSKIGGLVGYAYKGVDIKNCYTSIKSINSIGNISGIAVSNSVVDYTSTIINTITFSDSISGNLSNTFRIGNTGDYITLTNNYANAEMLKNGSVVTDGDLNNSDGMNMSSLEFNNESFYTTGTNWDNGSVWDFTDVWEMKAGAERPTLINVGTDDGVSNYAPYVSNKTLTTSEISTSGLTVTWTVAEDSITAQSNLQYLVYYSTNESDVADVSSCEENATAVGSYTSNILTKQIIGLEEGTAYYFNVIVKDGSGNKSTYMPKVETTLVSEMAGLGTELSPYVIMSIEDLAIVGKGTIAGDGKDYTVSSHYDLGTDLDFTLDSSYQNAEGLDIYDADKDADTTEVLKSAMLESSGLGFYPMGKTGYFRGVFDGGNFTINNLYINKSEEAYYVGLFGTVTGVVKNLTLANAKIFGKSNVGGIAGKLATGTNLHVTNVNINATGIQVGGIIGDGSNANIENCTSEGVINGIGTVGGIAGFSQGTIINKCYSTANINGNDQVGGIVGRTYDLGKISECYFAGNLTALNDGGGIVGQTKITVIENCYSIGTITTSSLTSSKMGGIVGGVYWGGYIKNCYTTINSISDGMISGIACSESNEDYTSTIMNTIAFSDSISGDLSNLFRIGNTGDYITLTNNYANAEMLKNGSVVTDGDLNNNDGMNMSSLKFNDSSFYTTSTNWDSGSDWNFTDIWEMKAGAERPTLRNVGTDDGVSNYAPYVSNKMLTTSEISISELTVSWTVAEDSITAQSNLQYLVYYSTNESDIADVSSCEANATAVGSYTSNILTKQITGLEEGTAYYFNVIVKDESENKAIYTAKEETTLVSEMAGSGTEVDPYVIMTIEDLAIIGKGTIAGDGKNYTMSADYKLGTDLDFTSDSSYQNAEGLDIYDADNDEDVTEVLKTAMLESSGLGFYPIGKYETIDGSTINNCFTGVFDGGNFTISNLYINKSEETYDVGLFGVVTGGVKNLTLVDAKIFGKNNVAAIAGRLKNGINLHVTNVNINATGSSVGGITGSGYYANIENCTSEGIINGISKVGGIMGSSEGTSSIINKCYSTANINGSSYVGGIVGYTYNSGKISECYFAGDLTASNEGGGLVGRAQVTAIENCYSIGTLETPSTSTSSKMGGLVGYVFKGVDIKNCYSSTKNINSDGLISGISISNSVVDYTSTIMNTIAFSDSISGKVSDTFRIGNSGDYITLTNNYANTEMLKNGSVVIDGELNNSDGLNMSSLEFNNESFYTTAENWDSGSLWDFTDIWEIKAGAGRPTLINVGTDDGINN